MQSAKGEYDQTVHRQFAYTSCSHNMESNTVVIIAMVESLACGISIFEDWQYQMGIHNDIDLWAPLEH